MSNPPITANPGPTERLPRGLNRFTTVLLVAYLIFIAIVMLVRRATLSPEVFFVFISVVAVLLGRGKRFVRDWAPFLLIFLAWEAMRGVANQFGATVQSDSVIAIERMVAFGVVMPEFLQKTFYLPGRIGPLEIVMAAVYAAHFVLPLTVAFVLWLKRRNDYYQFVVALMLMSFAQFVTAVLLPVAPPRFAGYYGQSLGVVDIGLEVQNQFGLGMVSWIYHNMIGNPVAAFPSLHAAYPILAYFFLRRHWPRLSILMLLYSVVVWFAIMYLGHHYFVDALGGLVYAVVSYWAVMAWIDGKFRVPALNFLRRSSEPGG
jgi:membrane-associated phospholipid phosphatase